MVNDFNTEIYLEKLKATKSKLARYRLTNKAVNDYSRFGIIPLMNGRKIKQNYHMLLESCKEVASNPALGKSYSGVKEDLLGFKAGQHISFYRKIDNNEIEVLRILHEQMALKNRIKEK